MTVGVRVGGGRLTPGRWAARGIREITLHFGIYGLVMGRQIAVAMTQPDEELFLAFLHQAGEIVLFESFAKTSEDLWQTSFAQEFRGHWTYHIWNTAFIWQPEYKQTRAELPERNGLYYVSNKGDAPLIEFTRSDLHRAKYGRVYWAKYFSAPNGLTYGVETFSDWYDSIVRWIKRQTAGKLKRNWVTYFLPDAWRVYNELQQQEEFSGMIS